MNSDTIEAMQAAQRGELVTVGKASDLLASLNADDRQFPGIPRDLGTIKLPQHPPLSNGARAAIVMSIMVVLGAIYLSFLPDSAPIKGKHKTMPVWSHRTFTQEHQNDPTETETP